MIRVVVIGNGMVGSRFVDELRERDASARFAVTMLGAEEHEPYNRVLLSDFVAGKVPAATLQLPRGQAAVRPGTGPGPMATVRGTEVVAIDRSQRTVRCRDGQEYPFDVLVLATGAKARILPLAGVDADVLPPGLHALRTLDDAREIVAATMNARRAVVIGAGVLGLEAATGLARRGLAVTLVHAADAVMERQLDGESSQVAVAALAAAGVTTELSAMSEAVVLADGRVCGLRLADGRTLAADLLVMACGTVPEAALAQAAGLECHRGIVVGANLATPADPRIYAIGDCAAPPEGGSGLIAQGWDQARRLAVALSVGTDNCGGACTTCGTVPDTGFDSPTDVVRVKGAGLDIVAMGVSGSRLADRTGHRAVRLSDPGGLRFMEVVVADGRVVGATCVGAGQVAADLVAAYTRGTVVPTDPALLLLRPSFAAAPQTGSPTNMPDRMTVCRCNGVTKRDIRTCFSQGARTMGEIAARTRATTGCGGCTQTVEGLLEWLVSADPEPSASEATTSQPARNKREADVPEAKHSTHGLETSAR